MSAAALLEDFDGDKQLVFQFFVDFSRFEYALKRTGFLKYRDRRAEANWDTFANSVRAQLGDVRDPDFIEARRLLLSRPPQTQVAVGGKLGWQETGRGDGESEERYLLRLVRVVRNNLFHGGKYPYPFGPVAEPARDRELLQAGVVILQTCLTLSPEVAAFFGEPA